MSMQLLEPLARVYSAPIGQAVLETLAYSDVFDHPLRLDELHRYLPVRVTPQELQAALRSGISGVETCDGFYFLAGRAPIVSVRQRREAISAPALRTARWLGRLLGSFPFIRMVALTGSLAVLNSEQSADLDFMLVTAAGRVWTARGFVLLLGKLTARFGHTLCPNLIVSEQALEWPQQDIYSAREICQMIPIVGSEVYERLRGCNAWTEGYLPNATGIPALTDGIRSTRHGLQALAEWPLKGSLGSRIESWEMDRKVQRFSHQAGFGLETRFNAQVCQGNFLHHGTRTREAFQERLARLGIHFPYALSPRERD